MGRYNKPEQYENIILKANPEGEILRLKDVAKVELGSSFFDIYSDIDGHPSAAIVLKQTPRHQRRHRHRGGQGEAQGDQEGVVPSRHGL